MDPVEQNQSAPAAMPVQETFTPPVSASVPPTPVVETMPVTPVEKKGHAGALWALLILVIIAVALFFIMGMTDRGTPINANDQMIMEDGTVGTPEENPDAAGTSLEGSADAGTMDTDLQ